MANLFRADFYGWRTVAGLTNVTVRQKFGNHTLIFLDYSVSSNQRFLMPPENTPLSLQLGKGPLGVRTTYGYVNHLEDRVDESGRKVTRLVALGTSKVMNTSTPTTWDGHSRSSIVRDLATRHRFRSVVNSHPEALPVWSAGSMTDWQAAKTLADEIGFRLWVDGPTVWLLDPHAALASASSVSTKVVRRAGQRDTNVFKGSNMPGQVAASKRLVQYGVSNTTDEVLVATSGDPSLPMEMSSTPFGTYTEAQYAAEATERIRRDQAVVETTLDGDATLTPGSPVRFADAVTPDQAGLWLVNSAEHRVSSDAFTTRISASRDKDRPLLSRVPDVVRRESALARSVVRNGMTWEAEIQERVDA